MFIYLIIWFFFRLMWPNRSLQLNWMMSAWCNTILVFRPLVNTREPQPISKSNDICWSLPNTHKLKHACTHTPTPLTLYEFQLWVEYGSTDAFECIYYMHTDFTTALTNLSLYAIFYTRCFGSVRKWQL